MGQPEEGASTVVEPPEVETSFFKTMLMFGYATCGKRIITEAQKVRTELSAYPGDAKWKHTNHVDQGDCETSGVTANGTPRDGLRALAGVPKGTLDGARDGDAHGGDDEQ